MEVEEEGDYIPIAGHWFVGLLKVVNLYSMLLGVFVHHSNSC